MLADPRDMDATVIDTALGPLEDMPLPQAERALETLHEHLPQQPDERLFDVIVAQQAFHYERSRVTEDGTYEQPQAYRFSAKFLRWLNALDSGGKLDEALDGATLYVKDYACGDKVLMNQTSELRQKIVNLSHDIYAIEMEGHGLLHSDWEAASRGHVETAMIKAVSDFGDGDMATDKHARQQGAAQRAGALTLALLYYYASVFSQARLHGEVKK